MSVLKVAQINCTSSGGSTGKIVSQLSQKMFENNIDNIIISSGYKEKKGSENVYFISNTLGIKWHQFLGFLFGDSGFHSSFQTRKAIRILEKYAPDAIHIHNLHGYYLNIKMLMRYLKKSGIPVVWTVHDCWLFTGHCTHYTQVGCQKWHEGCGHCPQLKQYPYSLFLDRSKRLFSLKKKLSLNWKNLTIVTVSKWLKSEVKQSFWKSYPLKIIHNGVDMNCFCPKEKTEARKLLGMDLEKFVILGVAATWNTRKGLADFIKLSEMLDANENIVLVGLTEQQRKNLPENIIGISHVEGEKILGQYYNAADIFVSFSYEETMGLTAVEAMACGTPALVYDSTASPELIHKNCGYVVKIGDISSALRCIREAKNLTKNHFAASCRQNAEEYFNQDIQYQKYCRLYEQISRKNGDK